MLSYPRSFWVWEKDPGVLTDGKFNRSLCGQMKFECKLELLREMLCSILDKALFAELAGTQME